jgi:hypothetical protein
MKSRWVASGIAFVVITLVPIFDAAASPPPDPDAVADVRDGTKLGMFASLGYLASPGGGGGGSAFMTGLRLAVGRHLALGLDLGWGLLATPAAIEDRWWVVPTMALVLPANIGGRRATFDLGAGFGVGTSSGYSSFSEFAGKPFAPDWAFQVFPAGRMHTVASVAVARGLDVFVRADAGSLILPPSSGRTIADSTWLLFSVGAQFRLL